jgi:tRNA pseudouridine38-40 synthase
VEYDGSAYAGFQRQTCLPTVQGALEAAVRELTGCAGKVSGSGRTDAGAHATGQVVSFLVKSRLDDAVLLRALNAHLPEDIALQELTTTDRSFDPRRHATRREYHYLVLNRPTPSPLWRGRAYHVSRKLDLGAMSAAAQLLVGIHDFRAFATPSSPAQSAVREIYGLQVGAEDDIVRFRVAGSGFMRHMIRSIVGTLIRVGRGELPAEHVRIILGSRDRASAAAPAPAQGLYLVDVSFAQDPSRQPVTWRSESLEESADVAKSARLKETADS